METPKPDFNATLYDLVYNLSSGSPSQLQIDTVEYKNMKKSYTLTTPGGTIRSMPMVIPILTTDQLMEITQGVRDTLESKGWTRGTLQDAAGKVCLVGAVNVSTGSNADVRWGSMSSQARAWVREFAKFLDLDDPMLMSYNDNVVAGFEELLGKLDDFMRELKGRTE